MFLIDHCWCMGGIHYYMDKHINDAECLKLFLSLIASYGVINFLDNSSNKFKEHYQLNSICYTNSYSHNRCNQISIHPAIKYPKCTEITAINLENALECVNKVRKQFFRLL